MGKKRLFGEVDDDDSGPHFQLTVNEEYAKRLQHNKEREELHRLEEKHKSRQKGRQTAQILHAAEQEDEESSSSSEDDEEELDVATELQDPRFLKLLSGMRRGNLDIDNPSGESEADDQDDPHEMIVTTQKKEKPILLKDIARGLTEAAQESSSEDDVNRDADRHRSSTYNQDLEGARTNLLKAANTEEASDEDELFGVSRPADHAEEPQKQTAAKPKSDSQQMLDNYFGKDEDLNADDLFLKRFILNEGQGAEEDGAGSDVDIGMDDDEDERHLEAADKFEAEHNFRFEEPGAERLHTFPRRIDGVVRQGNTTRAEARHRKQERKQQERAKQEAEIQRLKTLKRKEIEARMEELRECTGLYSTNQGLWELLNKDDFNEEEYDEAMAKAFGEEYYQEEGDDVDFEGREGDDLSDQDGPVPAGGFRAVQQNIASTLRDVGKERDSQEVQRLLDEYSKLEYEDIVAGMPTRFKYQQVATDDFGLSTNDILGLTDKELNQVVGLRRLAPFREERRSKRDNRHARRQLHAIKQHPREVSELADADSKEAQESHRKATYERPSLPSTRPQKKPAKQQQTARLKRPATAAKKPKAVKPLLAEFDTSAMSKAQKNNLKRTLRKKRGSTGKAEEVA